MCREDPGESAYLHRLARDFVTISSRTQYHSNLAEKMLDSSQACRVIETMTTIDVIERQFRTLAFLITIATPLLWSPANIVDSNETVSFHKIHIQQTKLI